MYSEFKYIILDYFKTLKRKEGVFDVFIPFLLGVISFIVPFFCFSNFKTPDFGGNLITLLSVLIGFSLAVFTIITTSSSSNIKELKSQDSEFIVNKVKVSNFHLLLIGIVYPLLVDIILLVLNLLYIALPFKNAIIYLSLNIFFLSHSLFVMVRSISNLYFVLTSKETE